MDTVERIAETVLYEGYLLWPYRRSAIKNQKRWNFGGVYPRSFSETARSGDPWEMQTQCLVSGSDASLAVKVKFLQAVERKVGRWNLEGGLDFVESLEVDSERYLAWEEAREQERVIEFQKLSDLAIAHRFALSVPEGSEKEDIFSRAGKNMGALVRSWRSLEGEIEVKAESLREPLFRITVQIRNLTPRAGPDREAALKQTFLSTHTILQVDGGEFISLTDPPEMFEAEAKACQNLHT